MEEMVKALASADTDRARWANGVGFDRTDGGRGHRLASIPETAWTDTDRGYADYLVRKYRAQLEAMGFTVPKTERCARPKERAALRKVGDDLVLTFPYSQDTVDALKRSVRARWNRDAKHWIIAHGHEDAARRFATSIGAEMTDDAAGAPAHEAPVAETRVTVDGGRIVVRAPYEYKDALKAIPGARWSPSERAWTYPESATIAQALARVLGAQPQAAEGARFAKLIEQAEAEQRAASALDNDGHDLDEIPGLAGESWPHQRAGYWWARERTAAMLAFRMRYGKTRTTIGVMRNLETTGHVPMILVLCPLSVVDVWPAEIARHAPDWRARVIPLSRGSVADKVAQIERGRGSGEMVADKKPLVVIVNYDSARMAPLADWLLKRQWDLVVLDESHRIKSPGGATSLFVSRLRDRARRRLCLTGTPMPHSPLDIYAQFRFLDPGIFGTSFVRFRNRYAVMGGYGNHQVVGWRDLDELNRRIYTTAYKPPDGIVAMPSELHIDRTAVLGAKARAAYVQLEEDLYAEVDAGTVTAANALVKLLRLAQLTGGVLTTDDGTETRIDTAKADLLRDVLADAGDEPVVVVCRFRADLDAVHEVCERLGLSSGELSGRRRELDAWQAGETQVLAVQIQAGGVGINLSRADLMILYSVGYSLGDYDQALARIRVSGKPSVQYIHLTVRDTVDEQIREALDKRADLVEAALRRRDHDDV